MYVDEDGELTPCTVLKGVVASGQYAGLTKVRDPFMKQPQYVDNDDVYPYDEELIGTRPAKKQKSTSHSVSHSGGSSAARIVSAAFLIQSLYHILWSSADLPDEAELKQLTAMGFSLALSKVPVIAIMFAPYKNLFVAPEDTLLTERTERDDLLTISEYKKLRSKLLMPLFQWLTITKHTTGIQHPSTCPGSTSYRDESVKAKDITDPSMTDEDKEKLLQATTARKKTNKLQDDAVKAALIKQQAEGIKVDEELKKDDILKKLTDAITVGMQASATHDNDLDTVGDAGITVNHMKAYKIADVVLRVSQSHKHSSSPHLVSQMDASGNIRWIRADTDLPSWPSNA
jgi:hypothetical protein